MNADEIFEKFVRNHGTIYRNSEIVEIYDNEYNTNRAVSRGGRWELSGIITRSVSKRSALILVEAKVKLLECPHSDLHLRDIYRHFTIGASGWPLEDIVGNLLNILTPLPPLELLARASLDED